jgi:DNA polymerase I-like protein with 3'-5' exonuclease and polymerase domains
MEFPNILKYDEFSYDTETTGLSPHAGDKVFGFSVSTPEEDYYWDIRECPMAVNWFNDQMKMVKDQTIITHNESFDYRISHATGIYLPIENIVDTCIQACLIDEHEYSYQLDNLLAQYTDVRKSGQQLYDELAKLFGGRATKNVQMKNISKAPSSVVSPYAKDDSRGTFELYQWQKGEIERQGIQKIINFERSLTPMFVKTEMHGVRVDTARAQTAVGVVSKQIDLMQKELNAIVGFACNPQPSGDMQKIFQPKWRDGKWWAIDGTPLNTTGSGAASIDADTLRRMSHPAAEKIIELRSMIKTRDTFLVNHVLESAVNGRVYPNINQTKGDEGGTGTGRLSYSGPALQQIPDRNKIVAEIIKSVFLPDEGHVWVDADKASFEVRMFAHLVGTPDICQAYIDNPETDFHQFVADLTGLVRNATYGGQPNAKQLNLSMIFNQGDGTTAEKMGMPWSWESFTPRGSEDEITFQKAGPEAKAIIEKYHSRLPGVKKLAQGCKRVAEERGFIFTRHGRRLRFPKKHKTYKASGLLIQASSADENKYSWLMVHKGLEGSDGKLLLNTHDSYSMSLPIEHAEELARSVKREVEKDRGLRVPLILEVSRPGANWWESKSSKRWM